MNRVFASPPRITILFLVWLASYSKLTASQAYQIRDLGPSGRTAIPGQLNDNGTAVYWLESKDPNDSSPGIPDQAFATDGISTVLLPSLGGSQNAVRDINNFGTAVGESSFASDPLNPRAVRIHNGTIDDLSISPQFGSNAFAINDNNQIVGAFGLLGAAHAYLYDATNNFTDLGTLGGTVSLALDINNNGIIIGYSELQQDQNHLVHTEAFVYKNGQMSALDVFGSQNSSATAINEQGQIVGGYQIGGDPPQPFLIDTSTGAHDIG